MDLLPQSEEKGSVTLSIKEFSRKNGRAADMIKWVTLNGDLAPKNVWGGPGVCILGLLCGPFFTACSTC